MNHASSIRGTKFRFRSQWPSSVGLGLHSAPSPLVCKIRIQLVLDTGYILSNLVTSSLVGYWQQLKLVLLRTAVG